MLELLLEISKIDLESDSCIRLVSLTQNDHSFYLILELLQEPNSYYTFLLC